MSRLLPLALVLALAATAWWLMARSDEPAADPIAPHPAAATPEPESAALPEPPATASDTSAPRPTDPLHPAASLGAAAFTLTDATGRSLWCDGDSLTLWRVDTTPARAATAQLTTTEATQLVTDLLPGTYRADLRHQSLGRIVGTDFRVSAGDTAREALPSGVADASRRLVLRLRTERDRDFPLDGGARVIVADGQAPPRDAIALGDGLFAADDIGPQGCDVTVRWLRESPLHLRALQPGALRTVELKGTATLVLQCTDDLGRPIDPTDVDVRLASDPPSSQRVLAATGPGGQLVLDRLPACDVALSLARKDRSRFRRSLLVSQDVTDLALASGVTTTRDVRLEIGTRIDGRAQYENGEPAIATVVLLARREPLRPAADLEPDDAALVARLETDGWHAWGVDRTTASVEEAAGNFSFSGVPAGPLRLVAGVSANWFGKPVDLEAKASEPLSELRVPLPPARWILGQLVMPRDGKLSQLSAEAHTPAGVRRALVNVEPDGSFKLGPLPPGREELSLWSDSTQAWSSKGPPRCSVPLGSVDVPADHDLERRFDLRDDAPGSLDVHVSIEGGTTKGVTVCALDPANGRLLASSMMGGEGLAQLDTLFGRHVRLVLSATTWESAEADLVDVPAWGRADVGIALTIYASDVRVQASDGRSLAGLGVHVGRLDSPNWRAGSLYVLDANQSVHLVGPPGRFWFSLQAPGPVVDERLVSLRWPPAGGEAATVIVGE